MTAEISVPAEMAEELAQFLAAETIDLKPVADDSGEVRIVPTGPDRQESDLQTLYVGGWISCETARALAKKLTIDPGQMGSLLDHVHVKVRRCALGCF